ncbi:hypothetical protein [Commensalibacter nepenthis]|uniref:Uncharacterized protein n=1 Tax=Commensalibacter nepenthis TaxID=3043872 RepID=A0ABT6QB46_9PROT|nr:hypothetical protein [Commensalibacter sp. TBRC 10068]MDI2113977.1 hypothetical protein [Commensalibacter sp. TBRC 10068]
MEQKVNYNQLYTSMHDFFRLKGSSIVVLTKAAVIEICKHAMDYDILIWRIESGIWHNPGYEPRDVIDSIYDPPVSKETAIDNNLMFIKNLKDEPPEYDVFTILITNYQGLPKEHLYDKYFEKHPNN